MKISLFLKRGILCFLFAAMFFSLMACDKMEEPSQVESTAGTEKEEEAGFVKPENYAMVVTVTINPQLRLYLDNGGKVLAVEAINQDAEALCENLSLVDESYESVVETIVTKAEEQGYMKKDAVIHVEVTETKQDTLDTTDVLDKITETVNQTAVELQLTVEVKTEDATDTSRPDEDIKEETSGTTSATESVPCSHTYNEATCLAPKTCSKCGATEGDVAAHNYQNGLCAPCGDRQLGHGTWRIIKPFQQGLYIVRIEFNVQNGMDDLGLFEYRDVTTIPKADLDFMISMNVPTMEYQGKTYIAYGGQGDICYHEGDGSFVTVYIGVPGGDQSSKIQLRKTGKEQAVVTAVTGADVYDLAENMIFEFEK
jgi:hypothetical protein